MSKVKQLCFAGQTIFCGIDVHKASWRVNIRTEEFELEDYSQPPCEKVLLNHLRKRYPGADYKIVYEAGFCGFGLHRLLKKSGVDCMVVNPSDVPCSDKDKKRKTDRVDARKLSRELANKKMKGIYVPDVQLEHVRSLVRQRSRLVQDQTRCKNRIWQLIMFSGLDLQTDKATQYWSRRFMQQLLQLPCGSGALRYALDIAIEEYVAIRKLLRDTTVRIRQLGMSPEFEEVQRLLRSIPGIGVVNGMIIQSEVQDISRFKTLDNFAGYAGIVPDVCTTGDREIVKGITHRSNHYLRPAIVESSWVIIRKDPAMLMLYKKYCTRMIPNKAIIKIARHLLSRIRYVWTTRTTYEIGVVG